MRNWIEINDMRSTFVKGLFINSIPPITKPAKRVNITTVDGMDGDILEDVGYEAYDKEFEVSMLPDGNIDDIIQFFDDEGKIMFSNEQGKYYRFKTIERIDFERLIRFRTATMIIHVQPFKYSDEVPKQYDTTGKTSIDVFNEGNIYSRPKLTITGSGVNTLQLNGTAVLIIDLTNDSSICIDTEKMEAYNPSTPSTLMNRKVIGDYRQFRLKYGKNTIAWTGGTISTIKTENTSRWI